MQFVNIRDLSRSPSKYVKLANEKEDVIITKNGHPYAVLTGINGDELEDFILAGHFDLEKEFSIAKEEYRSGKTISARKLLNEKTK